MLCSKNRPLALVGLGLLQLFAVAQAATITVDIADDEDNTRQSNMAGQTFPLSKGCSLREAMKTVFLNNGLTYDPQCGAATVDGPNTISFSKSLGIAVNSAVPDPSDQSGAVTKRWGALPDVSGNAGATNGLTIDGAANSITLTCQSGPGMNEAAPRLFNSKIGAKLTMSNMLLHDCSAAGAGIGIFSTQSDLTLLNMSFLNLHSNSGGTGGAIDFEAGKLTMFNVNFTNNSTKDESASPNNASADGGALWLTGIANSSDGMGGFVVNPVSLTNVTFTNNTAEHNGGAIFVASAGGSLGSTIQMTNALFTLNTAKGGLQADGATPNGTDGGGAIWASTSNANGAADLFLINASQFIGNSAPNGYGGAIVLALGSTLSFQAAGSEIPPLFPSIPVLPVPVDLIGGVFASNFTGNTAGGDPADANSPNAFNGSGGAIYSRGKLSVLQSSFLNNGSTHGSGGAIALNGSNGSSNTATLGNVTFNGNTADRNGGALANISGDLTLLNVTDSGNTAAATNAGDVGGGALWNNASGSNVQVRNSILGNSAGTGGNCQGSLTDNGNNLQYAPTSGCGGITVGDPNLGGPTLSPPNLFVLGMPINGDHSPAQGTGDQATCDAAPILKFDASGAPLRPQGDSSCDIGALESSTTFPVQLQSFGVD
jgi:predicted outer membrane repeat protein